MSELPAKRHQDKLTSIKERVKRSYEYFKPNYDRFNKFRKFVFESSLSPDQVTLLVSIGRPQLEFNVLEAYISRLLGEFSKQEPAVLISADDEQAADPQTIQMLTQHLKHVLSDPESHHTRYDVMKDLYSGGFSVFKVFTDYSSPMSMKQDIYIDKAFDPTLCGFDPMAKESHKGDGRFCFELFPRTKDEFHNEYPEINIDDLSFRRNFSGFNWSYLNNNEETLIVADYYEKKERQVTIVQVRDGRVMRKDEYDDMIKNWNDPGTVPPVIIGKPRKTKITKIVRYRCIENLVLEFEETDYTYLPLIFVDGNSVMIKEPTSGNVRQVTRPYVYHAEGAQKMKNFAGISLVNSIENDVQHKWMIAKEALPKEEEFLQAYKDPQKASVLVYNGLVEGDPMFPITSPLAPVPRIPCPPEIMQAFQAADSLIQMILGSFDASLGINNNQLSGVAVVEGATQSNAAAMPYVVGFMQGLQRAAQIYVDLIPKYFVTPRTIPLRNEKGEHGYMQINQAMDQKTFDYSENSLNVIVKADASFSVQKSKTLMMVKEMMGMSPMFAQFIAEKGLDFVLDNMEGKGIEELKKMVNSWVQEMQQQKQHVMQQQQAESQNNPIMMRNQIEIQKMQLEAQKDQKQHIVEMLKLDLEHTKLDADIHMQHQKDAMELHKAELDHSSKMVDLVVKDGQHIRQMSVKHNERKDYNG